MPMSDAFDGAGKPFKGPSFRAGILILLGVIVAMFIIIWNSGQLGHGVAGCQRSGRWDAAIARAGR